MQFKKTYTFHKINQDLAPDKRDANTHWNIVNMETFLTSRGASAKTANGTLLFADLVGLYVIGHGFIENTLYIFTTSNTSTPNTTSTDSIYEIKNTSNNIQLNLVKTAHWGFSTLNPIECVGIREHEKSHKLYWVDGYNQARFTNVLDSDLVVDYSRFQQYPGLISAFPYGSVASENAVVQYGFTQYNLGGSESKLSLLSSPVNISTTGDSAEIRITSMSNQYAYFRIYRVMWKTYKSNPSYAIIYEGTVPSTKSVTVVDDGTLFITAVSVEEFVDIGSDLFVPSTFDSKKQILFFGDYKIEPFDVSVDTRAFSFKNGGAGSLGPAVAIPSDEDIPFTPLDPDTSRSKAIIYNELYNPTNIGGYVCSVGTGGLIRDVDNFIQKPSDIYAPDDSYVPGGGGGSGGAVPVPEDEITEPPEIINPTECTTPYLSFTINLSKFYMRARAMYNDPGYFTLVTVYDHKGILVLETILRPTPLNDYNGIIIPVESAGALFYTVKLESGGEAKTHNSNRVRVSVDYAESLSSKAICKIYHTTIPTINGWVYSGVTGVLVTTRAKFLYDSVYSNFYRASKATAGSGYTTVEFSEPNGIYFNGKLVSSATTVNYDLIANLSGTRQQSSGNLKLRRITQSPTIEAEWDTYPDFNNVPINHDAINPDYSTYKYNFDGTTLGAEGPLVVLKLTEVLNNSMLAKNRVHKSGEVYRVGIVFQDGYGRTTFTKWVTDLQIPYPTSGSAASGYRNFYRLDGKIKYMPDGVKSFKFVYVKRKAKDKSVLLQGIVQPIMEYTKADATVGVYPFPTIKEIKGTGATASPTDYFDVRKGFEPDKDFPDSNFSELKLFDKRFNLVYTPETLIYRSDIPANSVKMIGIQEIVNTSDRTRLELYNPSASLENQAEEITVNRIEFDMDSLFKSDIAPNKLFEDYTDHDGDKDAYFMYMFFRAGGIFRKCTEQEVEIEYCKYVGLDATTVLDSTVLINAINQTKFARGSNGGSDPCNYGAEFSDCYAFKSRIPDWAGTVNYSKFLTGVSGFGNAVTDRAFPIVDILQNVVEQYGGNSFDIKSLNIYIDASSGVSNANVFTTLYGDVYNGVYFLPKATGARSFAKDHYTTVYDYIKVGLESEVNMEAANKILRGTNGNFDGAISSNLKLIEVKNLQDYNTVYSQIPDAILNPAKPFNFVEIKEYNNRMTPSAAKFGGEIIDNWTKVNLDIFLELESMHGRIRKLVRVVDDVFAFQDRAIAFISILPDKQVSTGSGNIQLAKGDVLDDYQYLTIDSGCANKQAIAVYGKDVFYIDTVNRTLNVFSEGEVSTLKGFNTLSKQLITESTKNFGVNDINGGFVFINNQLKQVLFKFSNNFPVLCYNLVLKEFTNSRTYQNGYYFISFDNEVIGASDGKLYRHDRGEIGDYYGVTYPASITMYLEPLPGVDKVFDAISVLKSGGSNFDNIIVESPTRTSGKVPLLFKDKFDIHNAHLPRVQNSRDRFRERNLKIFLEYLGKTYLAIDEIFVKFSAKKG